MNFGENLRRLRQQKHFTQEYVAEKLCVSAQAVSRWECSTTFPDILLLPEIARLYCVTVDDLFKEQSVAYENYAHRLLSVYEQTRNDDDFLAAEREYTKLYQSGSYTMKDMCMFGMLYQSGMWDRYHNAHKYFDIGLSKGLAEDEDTYHWIERQKILLESMVGHHTENIKKYSDILNNDPEGLYNYVNLIECYILSGDTQNALNVFLDAEKRFESPKVLYMYGGMIYRTFKEYDKAIECFDRAFEIDPSYTHALWKKAYLYEELGDYEKAYETARSIEEWYRAGGYKVEEETARTTAENYYKKLNG